MDFTFLNPTVRSAAIWERQSKNEERVGYDSRIIYVISGDITATVEGRKLGHLSPGHLLYIPAGLPYKLRGQYSRLAVLSFDLTADYPEKKDRIPPARPEDFKAELCHLTEDSAPFDKAIHIEDMESERDNLIQMCNIFTSGEGNYLAEISAMVKLLLLKISDAVDEHALPGQMVNSLDAYIRENFAWYSDVTPICYKLKDYNGYNVTYSKKDSNLARILSMYLDADGNVQKVYTSK